MYTVYCIHICTHLIISVYIHLYTMYICDIHTCDKYNTATVLLQELLASDAVNLCKGASSVCLSLSSNAQACQTSDWKFESSPKKIWHSTNNVHFKSLLFLRVTFLGSRLCFGPLFQVSVQRFAFLRENKSCRIRGGKVRLWSCCDLYHGHGLPTNEELGN